MTLDLSSAPAKRVTFAFPCLVSDPSRRLRPEVHPAQLALFLSSPDHSLPLMTSMATSLVEVRRTSSATFLCTPST